MEGIVFLSDIDQSVFHIVLKGKKTLNVQDHISFFFFIKLQTNTNFQNLVMNRPNRYDGDDSKMVFYLYDFIKKSEDQEVYLM